MPPFYIKDDMKLGVAASATQIEGGGKINNWYDWYIKGHIKDGTDPSGACDHFARFRDDADIMASLGIEVYKMSLEWSRVEPLDGRFSYEVLEHYREEIVLLRSRGIQPLLTLHHFSNPKWFEDIGGFENPRAEEIFLRFTSEVIHALGDLIKEYITFNEPNTYALQSYLFGAWPPGKKSFRNTLAVYKSLAVCHIKAYHLIHRVRKEMGFKDTKVGIANRMCVFEPESKYNPYHLFCVRMMEYFFQDAIIKAMATGKAAFPISKPKGIMPGKYYDFIGVNYYTRSTVAGFRDGVRGNVPISDLGWEIYPEGIVKVSQSLFYRYHAPIYITENGTCDNNDSFRASFIYEHLKALCESRLPIARYYYKSFLDEFEWTEGESARFGLVHVDFDTQERTIKASGRFFSRIIREKGVNVGLLREYTVQKYRINKH